MGRDPLSFCSLKRCPFQRTIGPPASSPACPRIFLTEDIPHRLLLVPSSGWILLVAFQWLVAASRTLPRAHGFLRPLQLQSGCHRPPPPRGSRRSLSTAKLSIFAASRICAGASPKSVGVHGSEKTWAAAVATAVATLWPPVQPALPRRARLPSTMLRPSCAAPLAPRWRVWRPG